ncbi:MAG: 4-(cytidine 5'-diphospho)-2-C-methyl-D-erythritol kinase [Methylobacterium sp.]|nr:MAG: 4-(cytidine 5'-diphospho)-2-C-methyl-D-erythritol kinase [Methylobacterium sp.]
MFRESAPAKINLFLHVLGRQADGYHVLESLVSFADLGDELELEPDGPLGLSVEGPFSFGLAGDDNLVMKAARAATAQFGRLRLGAFRLTKNLPVASGIGGGSSDAAAALRLIARLNGIDTDDQRLTDAARTLGADVPVCLDPTAPRLMHGIGHELGNRLYGLRYPAVLVNPVLPLETRAVFAGLGLSPGDRFVPMKGHAPCDLKALIGTRNDLEGPAKVIVPEIEDVLAALRASPGCRFARMSGSGATCFAIFDHYGEGAEAAARLQVEREWWARPTWLKLPS